MFPMPKSARIFSACGVYLTRSWRLSRTITIRAAFPRTAWTWRWSFYVCNLLAHEREALEQGAPPPELDMELLQKAGITERLPEWRKIAEAAQMNQGQLVG
jgi:hypothetical protein